MMCDRERNMEAGEWEKKSMDFSEWIAPKISTMKRPAAAVLDL